MRHNRDDDHPIMDHAVGFNFHFQIATSDGRKACSIQLQAHNFHDAKSLFRETWPAIESMAREALASSAETTEIVLTMPSLEPLTTLLPEPLTTLTVVERNAPVDLIAALALAAI